jgi:hypothetical protein
MVRNSVGKKPLCDELAEFRQISAQTQIQSMFNSIRHEPIRFVANTSHVLPTWISMTVQFLCIVQQV